MARGAFTVGMGMILVLAGLGNRPASADPAPFTGMIPLSDLGTGLYLDQFQGGLYANGSNQIPLAHILAGRAHAANIQPRDAAGDPDPAGKCVLLSVGMSNTTQEFWNANERATATAWSFAGQASANSVVNHTTLAIVDGAKGGQAADVWDSPAEANYDRVRDEQLTPRGLTEAQVQAIWIKQANKSPKVSLPAANADAYVLERELGDIVRACKVRYPNLQLVFLSSRIYAGYAGSLLNPEPYAYESAFSVKHLIQAQVTQMATGQIDSTAGDLNYNNGTAPWIAWGPYLWADGTNPRSDGLIWVQSDFEADGTHPATSAEQKVGKMLLDFLLTSPFSRTWFSNYIPGDINADGHVNVGDLQLLVAGWGRYSPEETYNPGADLNGDNHVNVGDLQILVVNWGRG